MLRAGTGAHLTTLPAGQRGEGTAPSWAEGLSTEDSSRPLMQRLSPTSKQKLDYAEPATANLEFSATQSEQVESGSWFKKTALQHSWGRFLLCYSGSIPKLQWAGHAGRAQTLQ